MFSRLMASSVKRVRQSAEQGQGRRQEVRKVVKQLLRVCAAARDETLAKEVANKPG
jgi:hypothetical protein